ncbi:MAG: EAL domain-containing protein [Lachnospiraceae bacterium]|nr:EAL domain-containing protein [Lachnospiraceae bacterium]
MEIYDEELVKNAECGMAVTKFIPYGEILYANDYMYRLLQYTREEFKEKFNNRISGVILEDEKQKLKALISRQSAMGGNLQFEFRAQRKDGTLIWLSVVAKGVMRDGVQVYITSCIDITNMKNLLDDAYNAKNELDLIANSIPGGVIKLNVETFELKFANDGFYKHIGYSRSEFNMRFRSNLLEVVNHKDIDIWKNEVKTAIDNRGPISFEYREEHRSGKTIWAYINGNYVEDVDGNIVYLCVIMDITERKKLETSLDFAISRISEISNMKKEVIWWYDFKKNSFTRVGYDDSIDGDGNAFNKPLSFEGFKDMIHPADRVETIEAFNYLMENDCTKEIKVKLKNDRGLYQESKIVGISDSRKGKDKKNVYGYVSYDVDEYLGNVVNDAEVLSKDSRFKTFADEEKASSDDNITSLLPYATFLENAEKVLKNKDKEYKYAVICADINEFKKYNQHYGFSVSNEILKAFSKILIKHLSKEGMCSRVDRDYFVMLFKYKNHKEFLKAMSSVVEYQGARGKKEEYMKYGSAIGIYVVNDEDGSDITEMLEKADMARRTIKGLKGNHYAIYTDDILKDANREEEIIEDILDAMRNKKLDIHYIPRVKDERENVIGCKALPSILLRNGDYVNFKTLTRLIEKTAKLEDLGLYIINEVAMNIGAWKAQGNTVIPVSIELSANQIPSERTVMQINSIIEKNGLEPKDFIFEIPERYFLNSAASLEMAIKALGNSGYGVLISRFGSDHMEVNALRRLPVTGIKLHAEYFNEFMNSDKDKKVFKAIVDMCEDMGLDVFCGSVQTDLQEKFVREIGCRVFEGEAFFSAVRDKVFERYFMKRYTKEAMDNNQ